MTNNNEMSAGFQTQARIFARRAAAHLREAADKLDAEFADDPLAQDGMDAIETLGKAIWSAQSCVAHAVHQHALAVLHRERERGTK